MTSPPRRRSRDGGAASVWEQHRGEAFGLAYRMLGSVAEAEDVLQETYLRLHRTSLEEVQRPGAWITRVVSRLCLDQLTSARARREEYAGTWLPEPLVATRADPTAEDALVRAESLTTAFLLLLERLTPPQRVAFLLRDVFGESYDLIAEVLGREEDACRHLAHRARRALRSGRPRFEQDAQRRSEVATAFQRACLDGDFERVLELLAPDVVVRADGGGVASAIRHPVHGADRATRFLAGVLTRQGLPEPLERVNGLPGLTQRDAAGDAVWVLSVCVGDGMVTAIDVVTNPDKLRRPGEGVHDLPAPAPPPGSGRS